jgi:diguanylate cyclase (GGDEF)-like protein
VTTPSRRATSVVTLVTAVVLGALYSFWPNLAAATSERAQGIVTVGLEAAVALGAGALLWWGSARLPERTRLAWRLMGIGVGLWGGGSAVWLLYILADLDPPQPGPPDALYLAMVPFVIAGLAVHPTPNRRDRVVRSLVDGTLVACSLLLIGWAWILRDLAEGGIESSPAATAVNALYPIADVLVVVMALAVFLQVAPAIRMPLGLFALGLGLVAATDVLYFVLNATGTWETTPLVLDSGWVVGFAIVGGSGWALRHEPPTAAERPPGGIESVFTVLPSWLAGIALLFGVLDVSLHRGDLGVTVPLMVAIVGLLLARQGLSVRQGRQLAARLARSVEHLAEEATHDQLTGLPNRIGLSGRLAARRRSGEGALAVLFADIDHLKTVNDSLGHEVGDRLICEMADHLTVALGADAVTRFGGDEFVSALEGPDLGAILARATRIVESADHRPASADLPVAPSLSAGLALWEEGLSVEEVMRRADTALFRAKQLGRRRVAVYTPDLDESTRRRVALEPELTRAIAEGELVVHYQPVFALESGELLGAEALVRWEHPEQGVITPEQFLGHADAVGLLEQIGDVVLDTAVGDFAELNRRPRSAPLRVAVNMSASELTATNAVRRVHDALSRHGLDPSHLSVEITEDVVVDDSTRRTIDQLCELGVVIAIDDFGTGNSSLRQLGTYPATTLKVDRTFIDGLGRDREDTFVVRAILNLAHSLGLSTVAEGVESAEQAEVLRRLGCDAAQGWHFERAQPLDALRSGVLAPLGRPAGHLGEGPPEASPTSPGGSGIGGPGVS